MSTRQRLVAAAAAAVVLLAAAPAGSAAADPIPLTPAATAYAAAATVGSASLGANLRLTGAIGGLLDGLIGPIVDGALNPLVAALQGSASVLVGATLGPASHLNAGQPDQQFGTSPAAFPADTVPAACNPTGAQPCFSASGGTSINAAPLATVGLGLLSGYTQQVPVPPDATNSIFARAGVVSPSIAALPGVPSLLNPIVSAGVVNAKANCPNDGAINTSKPKTAPTALVSVTGVNVLGGLVKFDVLNGQIANLLVNNVSYLGVATLPVLNVGGVQIAPYGSSVIVTLPLAPTQLLNGLGLAGAVVSQLLSLTPTSTLALKVIIGPSSVVTSTTATAWGLGVGLDLSGSLGFNLLGLVGATITVPSGITSSNYGNLLDLRLAYVACRSGTNTTPATPAIPPALV